MSSLLQIHMPVSSAYLLHTLQASHPGSPKLPVGLQIVGRTFDEAGILQLAFAYEQTRTTDDWPTLAFPALP